MHACSSGIPQWHRLCKRLRSCPPRISSRSISRTSSYRGGKRTKNLLRPCVTVAKIGMVSDNNFCSMRRTADLYTESISTMPLAIALRYTLGLSVLLFDNSAALSKGDAFADVIQLKFRDLLANRSISL